MLTWKELYAAGRAWHESPNDLYVNSTLADHCEEKGDLERATVYRWIAEGTATLAEDPRLAWKDLARWDVYLPPQYRYDAELSALCNGDICMLDDNRARPRTDYTTDLEGRYMASLDPHRGKVRCCAPTLGKLLRIIRFCVRAKINKEVAA